MQFSLFSGTSLRRVNWRESLCYLCSIENNLFGPLLKDNKSLDDNHIMRLLHNQYCAVHVHVLSLGYSEFARIQKYHTYIHKLYIYTVLIHIKYKQNMLFYRAVRLQFNLTIRDKKRLKLVSVYLQVNYIFVSDIK